RPQQIADEVIGVMRCSIWRTTSDDGARPSIKDRRTGHPDAPPKQKKTRSSAEPAAAADELLKENEGGEERDPGKVNDAEQEEQRHERPAAEQAIASVPKPHHEGASGPLAPLAHQEGQWTAALVKAGKLERRELIEARCYQNRTAPYRERAAHHRGHEP